jgi:hypothetical protein
MSWAASFTNTTRWPHSQTTSGPPALTSIATPCSRELQAERSAKICFRLPKGGNNHLFHQPRSRSVAIRPSRCPESGELLRSPDPSEAIDIFVPFSQLTGLIEILVPFSQVVESVNSALKGAFVDLARGFFRVFGQVKMTVLLGFTVAAFNLDRIRSYRAKQVEQDETPRPRTKRRRGTWADIIAAPTAVVPVQGTDPPD